MLSTLACRLRLLMFILSLAALAPAAASAQIAGGYGDYVDWEGWARVDTPGRAGLASSSDPAGGTFDYNHYEFPSGPIHGDLDVTAATLKGPGIIYRFWMPHFTATRPFGIRMYFDGETTPRIDTDSEHVLGADFSYFAEPLVTTFAGGQVCYEPIVFRDSLRIDTENRDGLEHYYQYSYRTFGPGNDLVSWNGTLDAEAQVARLAVVAMFRHAGQHPAGESPSALRRVVGPASIPGGGTLVLADLVGPGRIRRLNVRMDGATDSELDSLKLRMFWDRNSMPSVDVPVGWFFGAGDNRAPYHSLPMGTDSPDGFYCYWPMPFRGAARVELLNTMSVPVAIDSTVVEFDPGPMGPNMGYLQAHASEAIRSPVMNRFDMAVAFGTGHYVGNFLSVKQDHASHFMLEGDDIVIVDGADTLNGTGIEDAYNGGYYYNWLADAMDEPEGPSPPFAIRPLNGILRVERTESPPFARADQYRWMIGDRIPFAQSFKVSVECKYAHYGSRWKSVVFWYQLPMTGSGARPRADTCAPELRLCLGPIWPNPAADAIVIRFSLPIGGPVPLELFDVAGRKVATISDRLWSPGVHEVRWGCGNLSKGVYLVRMRAGGLIDSRQFVILR